MTKITLSSERPIVFDFKDYKNYVRAWIESFPKKGHGQKSRIAQSLGCHIAYISQVLSGHSDFSSEQAHALNALIGHSDAEADFFMLLVQRGRAGTHSLEQFYDRKLAQALEQRSLLRNRIAEKRAINSEDQVTYYSAWHYAAIHMAVHISELRSPRALAGYFGLSLDKTRQAIDFLISAGLVREEQDRLLPGESRIHLTDDSPMIAKHHANWRMQALRALDREAPDELHYSSVVSISQADQPRVREILLKAIEDVRQIIRHSKDEQICCYAIDLFGVGSPTS